MDDRSELRDLGEETKNLISDAIRTGNFKNLSRDVSSIANRAVKTVTGNSSYQEVSKNRRAYQEQFYERKYNESFNRPQSGTVEQVQYPSVSSLKYKDTAMTKVGAIVGMSIGLILGIILLIVFVPLFVAASGISKLVFGLLMILPIASLGAAWGAGRLLMKTGRYESYIKAIGSKDYIEVGRLAQISQKSPKFIVSDLKKMIKNGWFREGHLDDNLKTLMTTNKIYDEYNRLRDEQNRAALEQESKAKAEEERQKVYTKNQQEIFAQGESYIKEIHKCNDMIPGEEISGKIERMEHSVRQILDRAKEEPALTEDLRRLMNYYLPTTVKLLNAYADLDRQKKSTQTIENSKREIEDTIDAMNDAFDKLFDDMFVDKSLDITTDVEVMKNMLKQEGLV